jgi:hypothetical protein
MINCWVCYEITYIYKNITKIDIWYLKETKEGKKIFNIIIHFLFYNNKINYCSHSVIRYLIFKALFIIH